MDIFTELITEICAEEGIECRILSYGWLFRLTRGSEVRHIAGRHIDANAAGADRIACDKYACYTLLTQAGVPAIEHRLLFNPLTRSDWISDTSEWHNALEFFENNHRRVVVKPNNGWQGRMVYFCATPKALERAVHTIFQTEPNACLCPYWDISHEYRVYYVNGRCAYAYGKERAQAAGDGKRSVQALSDAAGIPADSRNFMLAPEYVPADGERVRLSWKHNLSNGAEAFELADMTLREDLYTLAAQAARSINIAFATVDIARLPGGALAVMEINAGVSAKKLLAQLPQRRETVKRLYAEALRGMFAKQ